MDQQSMIALIGVILALLAAIIGAFAYVTGEIRKVANNNRRDLDDMRATTNARLDQALLAEREERSTMRTEFLGSVSRVEAELRQISDRAVRRADFDALETRLVRTIEKVELKFDTLSNRLGSYMQGFRRHEEGGIDS
jgi:uncharacterized lipoprotein